MANLAESGAIVAVPATAAATAAPGGATDGIATGRFGVVRTLCKYAGTVNACNVRAWFRDPADGAWFEGPTTDELDPLSPGGASPVNEAREWVMGRDTVVAFQVAAVAGGGTVEVRAQGVDV